MTVAEAVTLIAAITAAITAISASLLAWRSASKLSAVHAAVDGQSERIEALAVRAGTAEGQVLAGQTEDPAPPPSV